MTSPAVSIATAPGTDARPGFVFSLACGAVVLGWLVERSRSVAVVALWHTMLNMASATDATTVAAPFVSMAVIGLAIVTLRRSTGATARKP